MLVPGILLLASRDLVSGNLVTMSSRLRCCVSLQRHSDSDVAQGCQGYFPSLRQRLKQFRVEERHEERGMRRDEPVSRVDDDAAAARRLLSAADLDQTRLPALNHRGTFNKRKTKVQRH